MIKKNYRTVRTKVYKFHALREEAKNRAIEDEIQFQIEFLTEDSPFYYLYQKMQKLQTPWFLGQAIWEKHEKEILESLRDDGKWFYKDGKYYSALK